MKKYFYIILAALFVASCSVDRISDVIEGPQGEQGIAGVDGQDGISSTIEFEQAENGYWLIVLENGVETQRIFIRDGVDGVDGLNGLDGIDGADGADGASVTMITEQVEGGWLLFFYVDEVLVSQIFVENGAPGTDGLDGQDGSDGEDGQDGEDGTDGTDGTDGEDGTSTTIQTEQGEGGYWIIFFEDSVEVNRIFIRDGINGQDGEDGEDGEDGSCECEYEDDCPEEEGKVELCHKENKNGTPARYHTIWVNVNAVQAHLNHGDMPPEYCRD